MDPFLLRLRLLNRILEKKTDTLIQILNITENQRTVLSSNACGGQALELFTGMAREKQKLIDTLNEGDRVFEKTFREISTVFETQAPKHAGLVKRMQDGVKRVTALDARIRVLESRNSSARLVSGKAADNKSARKRVAQIYEKNKIKNNR